MSHPSNLRCVDRLDTESGPNRLNSFETLQRALDRFRSHAMHQFILLRGLPDRIVLFRYCLRFGSWRSMSSHSRATEPPRVARDHRPQTV